MTRPRVKLPPLERATFHPNAMHDFIVHFLLRAVLDADAMAKKGKFDYVSKFDPKQPEQWSREFEEYIYSDQFEFWTEWIGINAELARARLLEIMDGDPGMKEFYRRDKR